MGFYENLKWKLSIPTTILALFQGSDWSRNSFKACHFDFFPTAKTWLLTKVIGRLVKKGVLHRYKVTTPEGSLPSLFAVGKTAGIIANYPGCAFQTKSRQVTSQAQTKLSISILSQS